MKFNTTYIQADSLYQTVHDLAKIKSQIWNFLISRFDLLPVSAPIILENSDERLIDFYTITRPITFDLGQEGRIAKLVISPSNWMRDLINRLNLKANYGLITEAKSVFRDVVQSPTSTIVKDEIIVQIRIDNVDQIAAVCKTLAIEIYEKIFEIMQKFTKNRKIRTNFSQNIKFVSSQILENEIPNATPKEREINYSLDESAYFLTEPGTKMLSGHIHTNLPPEIYDLRNFYQLVLSDSINTSVTKPFFVAVLANGLQLKDQLNLYDMEHFSTQAFYQKLIQEKHKVIEFRINIPRLLMSWLGKGHICELQADVVSEEAEIIASRHKIKRL